MKKFFMVIGALSMLFFALPSLADMLYQGKFMDRGSQFHGKTVVVRAVVKGMNPMAPGDHDMVLTVDTGTGMPFTSNASIHIYNNHTIMFSNKIYKAGVPPVISKTDGFLMKNGAVYIRGAYFNAGMRLPLFADYIYLYPPSIPVRF